MDYGSNQTRLGSLQEGYIVDVGSLTDYETLLDLIKALAEQGQALPYQEGLVTASLPNPPRMSFGYEITRNF